MKYWNESMECMMSEEMKKLQNDRFLHQLKYTYDNVEYYRELLEKNNITLESIKSIDDISKLPTLSKEDLRINYPFGLLARPVSDCVRVHSTSGTTGKRVIAAYTREDIEDWYECCARTLTASGVTKDDICQISYGYGLFTGGAGFDGGATKIGCLTLTMSSGNTERQLEFMIDLGATVLCCTASYAAYIGETLLSMGYSPNDLKLKYALLGAEPCTEEMRDEIKRIFGIEVYINYGLTEMCGPGVSFECEEKAGLHINEDYFYPEIIDPDTGEVLSEGKRGELVLTSLKKQAFPILRYRTRDICTLYRRKCSCGRTLIKMSKPLGRTDDMLIVRGVNVFPSQVETVLIKQGFSPNYLIKVDRVDNMDTFDVEVEMDNELFATDECEKSKRQSQLRFEIKQMLGINPKVKLVAPNSIKRSEGKAVRVIDKRKLKD